MLSIFHDTKDVFTLKVVCSHICSSHACTDQDERGHLAAPGSSQDMEKLAPKKGVIVQSVKEVLQALVDDSLVHQDKIGISNFFWSFPSEAAVKVDFLEHCVPFDSALSHLPPCGAPSHLPPCSARSLLCSCGALSLCCPCGALSQSRPCGALSYSLYLRCTLPFTPVWRAPAALQRPGAAADAPGGGAATQHRYHRQARAGAQGQGGHGAPAQPPLPLAPSCWNARLKCSYSSAKHATPGCHEFTAARTMP